MLNIVEHIAVDVQDLIVHSSRCLTIHLFGLLSINYHSFLNERKPSP